MLSDVRYQKSDVRYQMLDVRLAHQKRVRSLGFVLSFGGAGSCYQMLDVRCEMSDVRCQTLDVRMARWEREQNSGFVLSFGGALKVPMIFPLTSGGQAGALRGETG